MKSSPQSDHRQPHPKLTEMMGADTPWAQDVRALHDFMSQRKGRKRTQAKRQLQVSEELLQRVLDHVWVGRLKKWTKIGQNFYMAHTGSGDFLVAAFLDRLSFDQLEGEQETVKKAGRLFAGDIERILLPDHVGLERTERSYVHAAGHYFAIYRVSDS